MAKWTTAIILILLLQITANFIVEHYDKKFFIKSKSEQHEKNNIFYAVVC